MFTGTVKLSRSPRIPSAMARIDSSAAADGSSYACLIRANGSALGYAPTPADVGVGLIELVPAVTTGNGFAVGDEVAIYETGTTADGVAVAIGIASFRVVANDVDDVAGYIDTEIATLLTGVAAIKAQTDTFQFSSGLVKARVDGYNTGQAPLQPTTAGRTLDVTATGAAGIDLGNVENQSTTLALSGTTTKNVTDLATTLTTLDTEIDAITASIATLQTDAAAGLTAVEADIATAQADLTTLIGRLTALRAGYLDNLKQPSGVVVADVGNNSGAFKIDLTTTEDNKFRDAWCCFLTGALVDQVHEVTGHNAATSFLTFTRAFSQAPTAGDTFILINK